MKKVASLFLMGVGFLLALSMARAEDSMTLPEYPSDKMINNDDLSKQQLDPDRATINRMPAENSIEGSGAGGISSEPDNGALKKEPSPAPIEKKPAKSGAEGSDAGDTNKTPGGYDTGY